MVFTAGLLARRLSFSIEFSDKLQKAKNTYKIALENILGQTILFMLRDNTFNLYVLSPD
jgi:hypothetical protein